MSEMLELRHISKTFGAGTINEKKAVEDLSLTLASGDFVTIIGGNGAGKSTLFNAVAGVFYVDEGRVILDGEDMTFLPEYKRSNHLGRLFQDPLKGTAPHMTIEENLALAYLRSVRTRSPFGTVSKKDREYFRERLAALGLGLEDRLKSPVGLLSGGQRQALTLLMATLVTPKLLLLDEHTAALDPSTAEKVLELTRSIVAENNITCMMITHNIRSALELGNRTIMMDAGQHRNAELGGCLGNVALAEHVDFFAAVRAQDIAHVFHKAQHGNVHHIGHVHGLGDDQAHQLLRAGHYDDAVHRQRLEHRQRYVARARGHVHKQEIHILPDDLLPELLDGARNDGPAPHDRVAFVLQQQVHAHHVDACAALYGIAAHFVRMGAAVDTEQLRDAGAGDVGVQHAGLIAAAVQQHGQHGGCHALADAALAADDADHFFNTAQRVGRFAEIRGVCFARGAVFAAGLAIVRTIFAHCHSPSGWYLHYRFAQRGCQAVALVAGQGNIRYNMSG